MKSKTRSALIKAADKAMSLYVREKTRREYGSCPFCGKPIEHNFHFVTRTHHATRWDEKNCIGSCAGCNCENEYNPHPFVLWYIKRYGASEFENLVLRSKMTQKWSRSDLEFLALDYQKKYEALRTEDTQ